MSAKVLTFVDEHGVEALIGHRLECVEQQFGRAVFDRFLRAWFDRHAFQSVTTEDFVAFLHAELLPRRPGAISAAELADWLEEHEVDSVEQILGSMSLVRCPDSKAYERANYMEILQSWTG